MGLSKSGYISTLVIKYRYLIYKTLVTESHDPARTLD